MGLRHLRSCWINGMDAKQCPDRQNFQNVKEATVKYLALLFVFRNEYFNKYFLYERLLLHQVVQEYKLINIT